MKVLCGLVLQPAGLVRNEQGPLIVLDHQDHGSEEKRSREQKCVEKIQKQRAE